MEESTNADSLMKLIPARLSSTNREAIEINLFNPLQDALQIETTSIIHWSFLNYRNVNPSNIGTSLILMN